MNNNLLYFTYKDKGFLYSEPSNNILEVSENAKKYFETGIIDESNLILKEEIKSLNNLQKRYSRLPNYYFFKNSNLIDVESKFNQEKESIDGIYVFELNNQLEVVNYLIKQPISNNVKFVIKQNMNYIFDVETLKKITEQKIDLIYYSDVATFEKFVNTYSVSSKIFVELQFKTQRDFTDYIKIEVPSNIIVSFKILNSELSKSIFIFLENKIQNYLENRREINVSKYLDIVRLLKLNFGEQNNKAFEFQIEGLANSEINCNSCWAKKICHQSKIYGIFKDSPFLTQQIQDNCDDIRTFLKKYLTLLMLFKEMKISEALPIFLERNGYKIKIINP